ncbi:MAG: twin-arginine translocase subunit TatC, partial [Brevinematia bacterium]
LSVYGIKLNYFKPYEKFFLYLKLSFFSGLILSIPLILIQLISFILPALKKEEKSLLFLFSTLSFLVFAAGLIFSYLVILPFALRFFVDFSRKDAFGMLWGVSSYFDFIIGIVFSTSVVFQLPIILLLLLKLRILDVSVLISGRKYIILLIAFFSALFSPPDVISMLAVGVPLYLLFELSVLIGILFRKKDGGR